MGAGVEQVLPLEVNLWAAQFPRQPFRKIKRSGAPAKLPKVISQFRLKFRILLSLEIFRLQFLQRVHERFRHIAATIKAEVPIHVRQIGTGDITHHSIIAQFGILCNPAEAE